MEFLFINSILLVVIIFLFFILSWVWPPDSPWAPWWTTKKPIAQAMCKLLKISKKDIVYELGSGNATVLFVASEFGARGVGIEIDLIRYWYSKILIHLKKTSKAITIYRRNFFKVSLSDATVVFIYLVPKTLEKLKPKLLKELKPGTKIVSYKYQMSLPLYKHDFKNKLYIYKIS